MAIVRLRKKETENKKVKIIRSEKSQKLTKRLNTHKIVLSVSIILNIYLLINNYL